MLWGHSLDFWNTTSFWLMIGGAALGVLALLVTLTSSIILYGVSNKQQEQISKQVGPRIISEDIFLSALANHPQPKVVTIFFSEDAVDGSQLALQLQELLTKAKWNPAPPQRVSRDDPLLKSSAEGFSPLRSQVLIIGPWQSQKGDSPFNALRTAISETLGSVVGILEKSVPNDEVKIVILPKM